MDARTKESLIHIHEIYIKAPAAAIWDAITSPEWNGRYGYRAVSEYDLKPGGKYVAKANADMLKFGLPEIMIDGEVLEAKPPNKLVQTYRFIVEQDLASGSLKQVLQNYAGASRPFSILYPSSRHIPRRVRVLIDFLLLHLRSANGRKSAARAVPGSLRVGARAKRKS